jgi:ABC transporter substrate binding protein (PQQ-dependent alcohol dehydrogenase system)
MPLTSGKRRLTRIALLASIPLLASCPVRAEGPASAPPVAPQSAAASSQDVKIAYLGIKRLPPPIYDYESDPADVGIDGAQIAMRDMTTTGRLTGQNFTLDKVIVRPGESAVEAAKALVAKGEGLIIADLPAKELLEVSDALKGTNAALYNINAEDDRLRNADCRANVFHIAPSRSMLTDSLMQFLVFQKWRNVFLVVGKDPDDQLYAEAVRRSVKKFGLKLTGDKVWEFGNLARERADGPTRANAFVFTRGVDADMIVVADEAGNFGDYVQYHTAEPKLVGGTQGLVPATWSRVLDAWGSAQLQSRFVRTNKRPMRPLDYQAWVAVRAIGEAATRTKSGDTKAIADYVMHYDFEIAAFKGVPVSFRPWDRQLRSPVLLVQPRMLVSVAPEPGFLHPVSPLDTLGFDKPETGCKIPSGGKS